ncbi:heparan sulfate glucosamine 3-O-sulfotransferase 1-like [Physella acuta]|uniref:heparan sulfate glucosamine 3-O-sulfotransferase 1-like n=1 Tax=Physella acuta TaxID=109671 RepID=UPI0027DB671F|nr:heparan sulfate glucosamine 3-O-sulfotransferase 1-like [Physella acuta]
MTLLPWLRNRVSRNISMLKKLILLLLAAFLFGIASKAQVYTHRYLDNDQLHVDVRATETPRQDVPMFKMDDTLAWGEMAPTVGLTQKPNSLNRREDPKQKNNISQLYFFTPPPGELPTRRFPQCVIIGFGKCGTRALLMFLSLHPNIAAQMKEMHFYTVDNLFERGYEWYRNEMPVSYSNQITIEKSPDYVLSTKALNEIHNHFSNIKLIVLVRNPVDRLVSDYLQRYRLVNVNKRPPLTKMYLNRMTNRFDPNIDSVNHGVYHKHLAPWFKTFSRDLLLVLDNERLTKDPLRVIKKVETFLGLPHVLTKENFYLNETWGFYCLRRFEPRARPRCMTEFKGWKHPPLPEADEMMLYSFYKPHNEALFKLIGEKFDWEKKKDFIEL